MEWGEEGHVEDPVTIGVTSRSNNPEEEGDNEAETGAH